MSYFKNEASIAEFTLRFLTCYFFDPNSVNPFFVEDWISKNNDVVVSFVESS